MRKNRTAGDYKVILEFEMTDMDSQQEVNRLINELFLYSDNGEKDHLIVKTQQLNGYCYECEKNFPLSNMLNVSSYNYCEACVIRLRNLFGGK